MAFVEGLRLVPTAFLMLVPLLRSMDPSLEEAAAASGARPFSTLRRVTIGLMLPGILAVTIYQAMTALETFEVPGVLGLPVRLHVFATKVYVALQAIEVLPTYGEANALGILYLVVGIVAATLYWMIVRRSERYAVITGKGYRPRLIDLGRWRYPFIALVAAFILLSIVLPFLVMVYCSFVPYLQAPSWGVFTQLTWKHYELVFTLPRISITFWNTVLMAVITATATCLVSFADLARRGAQQIRGPARARFPRLHSAHHSRHRRRARLPLAVPDPAPVRLGLDRDRRSSPSPSWPTARAR